MATHSKRYQGNREKFDRAQSYDLHAAVETLKSCKPAKFDETVELALCLGVDPRKSDQQIRGSFSLPHGIGKEVRVIAFAEGEAAEAARANGALEVGTEDLTKKILDGWMDFDVAIAHPSAMRFVGKLGRILGPQGKMPSPKSGTVTEYVGHAVKEFRAGKIEYRVDAGANLHAPVGKRSFETTQLVENAEALIEHIRTQRPSSAKGLFLKKAYLSTTHGPGIKLAVQ